MNPDSHTMSMCVLSARAEPFRQRRPLGGGVPVLIRHCLPAVRDWYFIANTQRQHRTLNIQKDVLPYALCSHCVPCQPLLSAFSGCCQREKLVSTQRNMLVYKRRERERERETEKESTSKRRRKKKRASEKKRPASISKRDKHPCATERATSHPS